MTTQTHTNIIDLFRNAVGRQVETKLGVMLINDVLTHKTGVLKDSTKAPYLHLVDEMGTLPEIDLHPQKALELINKGECGAYKILAALSNEHVAPEIIAAKNEDITDEPVTMALYQTERPVAEMITDLSVPAVVVAAAALGMTTEQVAEAVAGAGEQGAQAAEAAPVDQEKKESKKAGTLRLFKEGQAAGLARKDIIAKMRTELGLSIPGANTYYQNCKSGMWK